MFLDDGNVFMIKRKDKSFKDYKKSNELTSITSTSLSSGIGINDDNGNSFV